ncbi:S-adenosyl-L-methionine-dependent methyltransferase [Amylostereum chailletii]|nr:S-adenosyl-L-methionine-dependent methyltransferase [Amylostereum chailletii]
MGEPTEIRALEFYSGIGGLHFALARSNVQVTVVGAFDWDQIACQVYAANHGHNIAHKVDISVLDAREIAKHRANLWLLSPACQPYTVLNPLAKGAADPRAKSFLHLVEDVLPELVSLGAQPKFLLVENVAGFETSTTRQVLLRQLRGLGYHTLELLLTPLQFGIPNSRLRYYLLAKITPFVIQNRREPDHVWRHIPGRGEDWIDPRDDTPGSAQNSVEPLQEYLDKGGWVSGCHPHAVPDRVLQKWGRLFDIVLPSTRRTCCFTRGYTQLVERAGSILQENTELDTTATFDTFLKAKGRDDPDALNILHPLKLRYFTPSELLRLFAFVRPGTEDQFVWPPGVSTKVKYRLLGNSVNVRVVSKLVDFLFESG